jgi:GTP-binding protein LepA
MRQIRNFVIIAHIDHGKSTLADRFLEFTGTVEKRKMREQFLDVHPLEREKGITIKMAPVRMIYQARTNADGARTNADTLLYKDLTYKIRGATFAVKKNIGIGHKEAIYQKALEEEFKKLGLYFEREKVIDIFYDGKRIGIYRPDFIVEGKVLIELKALPFLDKREVRQLWTYLKGSEYKLALLINFSSDDVHIKRIIYDIAHNDGRHQSASSPRESAFILNLIDTPGHIDFSYEVSRALACVEGAILLVDATQGVQAQTLANLELAKKERLCIVPAINKIDLPSAEVEKCEKELRALLEDSADEVYKISAKTGEGVEKLLRAAAERIPPPQVKFRSSNLETVKDIPLRALIFDFTYDSYQGVIAHVRVFEGSLKKGERIVFMASRAEAEALEIGVFKPDRSPTEVLSAGEIGYVATGLKEPEKARVGDTITALKYLNSLNVEPLPGYQEPAPMVYASIFPENQDDFEKLRDSLKKLKLNDAALIFEPEESAALGRGYRAGFLGMLHMEIVSERLRREYNLFLIFTNPSVAFRIKLKRGGEKNIYSAALLPPESDIEYIEEPIAEVEIITPPQYLGALTSLIHAAEGRITDTVSMPAGRLRIKLRAPLREIITDFYDKLKSISQGFASMAYRPAGYVKSDLVRLDILVAGEPVYAFSEILPKNQVYRVARERLVKLKELIPRELFPVALQGMVGGKIIARETIPALKKDVTGYLYGGDRTRKMKLWKKQQKGKKRLKERGRVDIPAEVFLKMLKKEAS